VSAHDELRFDGEVVVITGAGSGIGRACAIELGRRGAKVVVNDISADAAEAVVRTIASAGGEALASSDSVATEEGGAAIVGAALEFWGRVDAVVAVAGNMRPDRFEQTPFEDFRALLDVHVLGCVSVFQPAYRHMIANGGGRLVIMSSTAGTFGGLGHGNYGTAKAGQVGLMHSLAFEGAPHRVRVNTVLPWARGTGLQTEAAAASVFQERPDMPTFAPEDLAEMTPERIASMVVALAHSSCPWTNRQFTAFGRWYGRVSTAYHDGWVTDGRATPEDIVENWDAIVDGLVHVFEGDLVDFNEAVLCGWTSSRPTA
jgi:NAD(P)-dependent dehydrogenase (short-subunit alcohol dehydrogenase family)